MKPINLKTDLLTQSIYYFLSFSLILIVQYVICCFQHFNSTIKSTSIFHLLNTDFFLTWFPYNYTENLSIYYKDYIKCPPCNFNPVIDEPSSTPYDVILSSMFGTTSNIIPMARSLRTTGSKSTFFILTNNDTYSKIEHDCFELIKNCGVFIINLGVSQELNPREVWVVRILIYYNFLVPRQHLIHRIFLIDLYDSIFQGDPFPTYFEDGILYFCSENLTFSRSRGNRKLIRPIVHNDLIRYYKYNIINGGTILGTVPLVIKYLEIFMIYVNISRIKQTKAFDQAFTNFFIYSNILTKHQIKFKVLNHQDFVVCIHGMQNYPGNWILGKYKTPVSKKKHLVLHQFDRCKMMIFNVYISCPRMGLNITDYMRGIKNTDYLILDQYVLNKSFFYNQPKLNFFYFES